LNDFIPSPDNTHDLGTATLRWRTIYCQNLNVSGSAVDVTAYGAVPDAKSITTGSTDSTSTTLTAPANTFVAADAGKTCLIFNQTTYAVIFKGTIATFSSGTTVILSGLPSATISGTALVYWGTDNATAIASALTAAAALTTGPDFSDYVSGQGLNWPNKLGRVRVVFPTTSAGSMYLFGSQLIVAKKVEIDAEAMLFSAVGTKAATDRTWAIVFNAGAHCRRMELHAAGGMGCIFGTTGTGSHTEIGNIFVWKVGTNYDPTLSPKHQTGISINGYDYSIGYIGVKDSACSFYFDCADIYAQTLQSIGAGRRGYYFIGGNKVRIDQAILDEVVGTGFELDLTGGLQSAEFLVNLDGFNSGTSGMTYMADIGINGSASGVNASRFTLNARNTGGAVVRIANNRDCDYRITASNFYAGSETARVITKVIEYGTGNILSLKVDVSYDTNIASLFSGTQYGELRVVADTGTGKLYSANTQVFETTSTLNKSIALSPFSAATAHGDATLYWAYNGTIGATTARAGTFTTLTTGGAITPNGSFSQGTAFKFASVTTGSIAGAASAAVTLTFSGVFTNSAWMPVCSLLEATTTTSTIRIHHIESITNTTNATVVVRIVNDDAVNAKTGTLYCYGTSGP
jgi:hypothetical protein